MNAQEKQELVSSMSERFASSGATYVVDYKGCTCEALTNLRKELRPSGAEFAVVKNTLAKLAVAETEAVSLNDVFVGPTAIVWSDSDPVEPAKVLKKFAKGQEQFSIKAGVVEGRLVDVAEIESLASLPSKEELIAKLLALLNAPATRLLQTVNAPATNLVRLLGAYKDKIESSGE